MAPRPSVSAASSPSVRAVASSSSSLSSTASTSSKTSAPHQAASHADRFVLQGRLTPNAAERVLTRFLGLRYHEDLRTLMFCGLYFSLVALQLKVDFPWRAERIALFWLTGFLSFLGAVTVHNAVHCPIFKQNWKNQMFQVVLSVWFGHCASSYVPGHNLSHHRNLQTPKDVMRTTKMKFRWNFLNGLLFMPTILMATGANDANYFNAQAALKRPIYYQLRFEALVYVAFQVLVAAASPQKWLFVCWLPCLVGKYGIVSLNMLQHDGCDVTHKYNHSRNFVGPVLNYFCFNNGYHGIHHSYPGKHWSLLKWEHERRIQPHLHPSLDQANIFQYIWEQFVWPGLRVDFRGDPVPIVDDGPDEPWFYGTFESYSDRDVDRRVWTKDIAQFGPEDDRELKAASMASMLAPRAAKSYTCD